MRQYLREYPNDSLLLVQLSTSLEHLDGTPRERSVYLQESIAVQKQILRYGEDSAIRGSVMFNICYAYWKNGQKGLFLIITYDTAAMALCDGRITL